MTFKGLAQHWNSGTLWKWSSEGKSQLHGSLLDLTTKENARVQLVGATLLQTSSQQGSFIPPGLESQSLVLLTLSCFYSIQHPVSWRSLLWLSLHRGCKYWFCSARKECVGKRRKQTYCWKIIAVFLQTARVPCAWCLRVFYLFS